MSAAAGTYHPDDDAGASPPLFDRGERVADVEDGREGVIWSVGGYDSFTGSRVYKVQYPEPRQAGRTFALHRPEFNLRAADTDQLRLFNPRTGPGSYPWPDCMEDQIARYGDEDTARKVCGTIRARSMARRNPEDEDVNIARLAGFFPLPAEAGLWTDGASGGQDAVAVESPRRRDVANPGRSEVQAVAFPKGSWTPQTARKWLKAHGHRTRPVKHTRNYLRYQQHDPAGYKRFSQRDVFSGKRRIVLVFGIRGDA